MSVSSLSATIDPVVPAMASRAPLSPPPPIATLPDSTDVPMESHHHLPSPQKQKRKPKPERVPGQAPFPLPRVQKIMKAENELVNASKEAVFIMALATEEFIKRLSKTSNAHSIRQNRAVVTYQDMAFAVHEKEDFSFLQETIPHTIPLSVALARRLAKQNGTGEEATTSATSGADRRSSLKGKGKARVSNGRANGINRKRSGSRDSDETGRWNGEILYTDGQATRWMHTRSHPPQPTTSPLTTAIAMSGLQWQHHIPPAPSDSSGEKWNGPHSQHFPPPPLPPHHRYHPHSHVAPPPPDGRWPAPPTVYHQAQGRTIYTANLNNSHASATATPSVYAIDPRLMGYESSK